MNYKSLAGLTIASALLLGACGETEKKEEAKTEEKKTTTEKPTTEAPTVEASTETSTIEPQSVETYSNENDTYQQNVTPSVETYPNQQTETYTTEEVKQNDYPYATGEYDTNSPTYEEDENGNWVEVK